MAKDILIYGQIDEYRATVFNDAVCTAAAEAAAELSFRICTEGGSPEYSWAMIGKLLSIPNKKNLNNDGKSYSMGLYFNCYVDKATAYDTTRFILHRAAYSPWMEESCSEALMDNLAAINKSLRAALEAKIDVEKFENLKSVKDKGITLDKIFAMDSRIDVPLTAKEAKAIGLIDEIITITPKVKAEVDTMYAKAMAHHVEPKDDKKENVNINPAKQTTMTKAEIQAQHAAVYAEIVAEGVKKEKDRVGSIMAYIGIDPEGVKAAINSGENLTETQRSEFAVKAMTKALKGEVIADANDNKVPDTTAAVTDKTVAQKKIDEFIAEAKAAV